MHEDTRWQELATDYDQQLTRNGFTRICDYRGRIVSSDLDAYESALVVARDERPMQRLLSELPHLLVNAELAHGCRWFKAMPRLGKDYVPDFATARLDSIGLRWTLVELQSPAIELFVDTAKPGRAKPGVHLREGLDQISRWRGWLERRGTVGAELDGYLGLTVGFRGVVIIGRSNDKIRDANGGGRLAELEREHRVEVQSYDHIYRAAWSVVHGCGVVHRTRATSDTLSG